MLGSQGEGQHSTVLALSAAVTRWRAACLQEFEDQVSCRVADEVGHIEATRQGAPEGVPRVACNQTQKKDSRRPQDQVWSARRKRGMLDIDTLTQSTEANTLRHAQLGVARGISAFARSAARKRPKEPEADLLTTHL